MIVLDILKLVLFSFIINWCISLQIFQQSLDSVKARQKRIAVLLAMIGGILAGMLLVW